MSRLFGDGLDLLPQVVAFNWVSCLVSSCVFDPIVAAPDLSTDPCYSVSQKQPAHQDSGVVRSAHLRLAGVGSDLAPVCLWADGAASGVGSQAGPPGRGGDRLGLSAGSALDGAPHRRRGGAHLRHLHRPGRAPLTPTGQAPSTPMGRAEAPRWRGVRPQKREKHHSSLGTRRCLYVSYPT